MVPAAADGVKRHRARSGTDRSAYHVQWRPSRAAKGEGSSSSPFAYPLYPSPIIAQGTEPVGTSTMSRRRAERVTLNVPVGREKNRWFPASTSDLPRGCVLLPVVQAACSVAIRLRFPERSAE